MEKSQSRIGKVIFWFAVAMSVFQLYTAMFGTLEAIKQRSIHLMFALPLAFVFYPIKKDGGKFSKAFDYVLALIALLPGLYLLWQYQRISTRWLYSAEVTLLDTIMGLLLVILLIEAARRVMGNVMAILVGAFFLYALLGKYIPGYLNYAGKSLPRVIEYLYMSTEGIFGSPLGTSASYVVLFIIFGEFLSLSGSGEFFMDLAISLAGRSRGGPAKIGVISSALFGTISGAAVANVYATGSFTIPMMKKVGYRPQFAGAVEAVASTGGQLMPPVMGSAAFIMADMLGVPYFDVMKVAIVPAILYFLAVYVMVDNEAAKTGLKGLPEEEIPSSSAILKKIYLLIPPIGIIVILSIGFTASLGALIGIGLSIVVSWFNPDKRIGIREFIQGLYAGAKGAVLVAIATGAAGIIVGVSTKSGLGFKFTGLVTSISQGNIWIAGILVMIASVILGMGLPTVAAYIMVAALTVPALTTLGTTAISAQMFVFYYCSLSSITPPVALSAYAGASIAGSDPFKTGFTAVRLGLVAFIVPFMFLTTGELLLIGTVGNILVAIVTSVIGTYALSMSLQGWMISNLNMPLRVLLFAAALLTIKPGVGSDLIGLAIIALVFAIQKFSTTQRSKKAEI